MEKTQLYVLPRILAIVHFYISSEDEYDFHAIYHKAGSISAVRKPVITMLDHTIIFDITKKSANFFNTILAAINQKGFDTAPLLEEYMIKKRIGMTAIRKAKNEALLVFCHIDESYYHDKDLFRKTIDTIYTIALNYRKESRFITPTYDEIVKHYQKEAGEAWMDEYIQN